MSGNDSKDYFIVKPFPGATISDMDDFIKPLSRKVARQDGSTCGDE